MPQGRHQCLEGADGLCVGHVRGLGRDQQHRVIGPEKKQSGQWDREQRGWEQKAEQLMGQGKGMRVAIREGAGLIWAMPDLCGSCRCLAALKIQPRFCSSRDLVARRELVLHLAEGFLCCSKLTGLTLVVPP